MDFTEGNRILAQFQQIPEKVREGTARNNTGLASHALMTYGMILTLLLDNVKSLFLCKTKNGIENYNGHAVAPLDLHLCRP